MLVRIFEATNVDAGGFNYGKFLVGRFEEEWEYRSLVSDRPLLSKLGWTAQHLLVLDLATGEGALFRHHGLASSDLHKHRVWVCPLFEPFLAWLYRQDVTDLTTLPALVQIEDPTSAMHGYRREGSGQTEPA